jgi:hypothetical protein
LCNKSGSSPVPRAASVAPSSLPPSTLAIASSPLQVTEATAWENVSRSADYAEPYPAEYPADELAR